MKLKKRQAETYVITDVKGLDPVTAYVTNYKPGVGKLVIDCFGDAWAYTWSSMGDSTLQEFVLGADNSYLLGKLCREIDQTDFDEINRMARERGFAMGVTNDVEVAMASDDMKECFGDDWYMDLPRCQTRECRHLSMILDAIKAAFKEAKEQSDE